MNSDDILIVPPDVDIHALGDFVLGVGPIPPRCYVEPMEQWMARGRVPDCDCGLLQCECVRIRPHDKRCAFRLSLTGLDLGFGELECDCGVDLWLTSG